MTLASQDVLYSDPGDFFFLLDFNKELDMQAIRNYLQNHRNRNEEAAL